MSSALGHVAARVASEQDRLLAEQPLPSSDDILAGIGRRRRRASNRTRAVVALSTALAIVLAVAFGMSLRAPAAPPAVALRTHQPELGVTRAATESVPLSFADGTKLVVMRGATADLREVREHGAVIALHEGTMNVDVVHTAESRWEVNAGPFGILVTGTKFDATWDASEKRLTVAMTEGTVVVSGPCVNEALAAPNRKVFSCSEAAPPVAPPPAAPAERVRAPGPIVETAATLVAEADKARLAGDAPRARQLYAGVRDRFPGTDQAGKSAFLLGRMADAGGSADEAARWFEMAARERGGFAPEALGRLMELEQKRGHADRAHALAVEYLKKYPSGPHAAYATSIVEARR